MVIPPLPISYLTPLPPVACILEGRARSHLTASRAISRLRVRVWNVSRVSSWLLPRPLFDEDNGSIRLGPLPPGNKGGAASRTDTGHFPTLQGGARRWLDACFRGLLEPPALHLMHTNGRHTSPLRCLPSHFHPSAQSTPPPSSHRRTLWPGRRRP